MNDEIDFTPCCDIRGELGPMLDQAIADIAPSLHVMWDVSYALVPLQGGTAVRGMVVLTMPSAVIGEGVIAGTICDLRRLINDMDTCHRIVARLVEEMNGQVRSQINAGLSQLRQPPPGHPG